MRRIRWAFRILRGRGVPIRSKVRAATWILQGKMKLIDESEEDDGN